MTDQWKSWLLEGAKLLLVAVLGGGATYVAVKPNASPESKTASPQVAVTISAAELRKMACGAPVRPAREGNAFGTLTK